MEIRKVLVLRGPNYWANFPVLEAWVDLGPFRDSPSDELPGFNERLTAWLPSMIEHRCSEGCRGGFFERLRRGTYQGHILEHVALELQSLSGTEVGFGRTRETTEEGVYKVAVEFVEEALGKACLEAGRQLCLAAIHDRPFDLQGELRRLRTLCEQTRLGPSTNSIVQAALARGIPARRLNSGSLVQLGYGARQRRILASETDRTGTIGENIAQDKELTRSLLRAVGVPVPEGRTVESAEDAWGAAEEIGLPVVVKPQFGSQGRGVATNLSTKEQVAGAYAAAQEEFSSILVEQFAPGGDYRLLVVGEKLVAAARREPAQIIGDGKHSVEELVQITNDDPRRGDDHATSLSKIPLDAVSLQVLADQSLTPASIPAAGDRVLIRRNANLSTGGTATDVTDLVHPEVAARAIEAARVVGLDVAGVDVVALDISIPLEAQRGVVVEVNAAPGLRMHLQPSAGKSRPVGEAVVATLFAPGETGRIPIVAVTGVNGKTTTTRFISHILRGTGRRVGMTCTEGIYIDQRRIQTGDCSGPQSAQNILLNPAVDAAVLETARGGILRAGLGFDRCDVAVVTNIGEGDHLGLADIDTLEKLCRVKRTVVEALAPTGCAVLNAADPLVAEMAAKSPAPVVYFATAADHPVVRAHRAAGERAVTVRDGIVMLCEGELEIPLVRLDRVPLTHGGRVAFQVENTLAAIGAVWSLGLPREAIRSGVESFTGDIEHVPGRFNLLDIGGVTVIVDYGHNPSSLLALSEAMKQFPHERRTAVYTCAGDRRDCDMVRQGELLGDAFDRVILYEDHYVRGRKEGEIMGLLRQGLTGAKRALEIQEIRGSVAAIEMALSSVRPGELLMIQADTIDETVDYVRRYLATHQDSHEISLLEVVDGQPIEPLAVPPSPHTPKATIGAAVAMTTQNVD